MWFMLLSGTLAAASPMPAECAAAQDAGGCVPFSERNFQTCWPSVTCYTAQIVDVPPRVVRVRVDVFGGEKSASLKQAARACQFLPKADGTKFDCRAGIHTPGEGKRRFKVVVEP